MDLLKKLKQAGGIIKTETKKDWQKMKEQYPKAKENVRRAKVSYGKIMKGAKKVHAEGRKTIKGFSESLPKVPDDYFERFNDPFNELAGKAKKQQQKKRKPKKKVVYYY